MPTSPCKVVVDELIKAMIARPETFSCGEHTLQDSKSGLEFWVSNGRFSGGVYSPYKMPFGAVQSVRFHRALRVWKAWDSTRRLRLVMSATQ